MKKKNTKQKEDKYISLKEAAKLSGYSSDYIGYLIRTKKIRGKSVSLGKTWMITPETLLNYKVRRKKENKIAKNLKIKRFFLSKKISRFLPVFRHNFSEGLRYALPGVLLFLIVGISALVIYAFPKEEQKIEIFPIVWSVEGNGETNWLNAQNVLSRDLDETADLSDFNLDNSAGLSIEIKEATLEEEILPTEEEVLIEEEMIETIEEIPEESGEEETLPEEEPIEEETPVEEEMPADEEVPTDEEVLDSSEEEPVESESEIPSEMEEQTYLQKFLTNLSLFSLPQAWAQEECEERQEQEEVVEQTEEEIEITEEIEDVEEIILPTVDGEIIEEEETSEQQEVIEETEEQPTIFTNQASIILSGFALPEDNEAFAETKDVKKINVNFSFASQGQEAEDDQIIFEWSLDEEPWNNLVTFNQNQEYSNNQNSGFFSFGLSNDFDWREIDNLKIRISYLSNNNISERLPVYLDSVWLELFYDEKNDDEGKIEKLSSKKDFKSKEEPEFDFHYIKKKKNVLSSGIESLEKAINTYDFWENVNLTIEIKDFYNETSPQIETEIIKKDNGDFSVKFKKTENFKPGLYTIVLRIEEDGNIVETEQSFVWGVLAINTNKSIYLSGEQTYLQMASLADNGDTICDANLFLEITAPDNTVSHPDIQQSGFCGPNNVTDVPDYFSYYQTQETGSYQMHLINLDNGYEIFDSFEVWQKVPFGVERIGPIRIYPPADYEMTIKVKINQDFTGQIIEQVPACFEISDPLITANDDTNNRQEVSGDWPSFPEDKTIFFKEIIYENVWQKGETYELTYQFHAPFRSPQIYFLGPLQFISRNFASGEADQDSRSFAFAEARQWQIAADAAIELEDYGTPVETTTTPYTMTGDNTITITNADILIVQVYIYGTSTVSSIAWDPTGVNEALTLARADGDSSGRTEIWYKTLPTIGTKDIRVNYSAAPSSSHLSAFGLKNVHYSQPVNPNCSTGTGCNGGTGSSSSASTSITTQYNNSWIISVAGEAYNDGIASYGSGQTGIWSIIGIVPTVKDASAGSYEALATAGSDTQTFNWNTTKSRAWAITAVEFRELLVDVVVTASGTQEASVDYNTADFYVGGKFVIAHATGSSTVTGIKIQEQGTVDAQNELSNAELYYDLDTSDPYDCASEDYAGGATQFGTSTSFDGADGKATFTNTGIAINQTQTMCVYVVLDVDSDADLNETIDVQITNPYSGDITLGDSDALPLDTAAISGSTTIKTDQSSSSSTTAYSFQRKTWYDGIRYWKSFNNGSSIQFWYSTDQTNWYSNSNATIDVATNDFSVEADSSYAFIAYTDGYDVKTRAASSYPNIDFSWDTATTPYIGSSSTDEYDYPTIGRDTNNKVWVTAAHHYSSDYTFKARQSSSANSVANFTSTIYNIDTSTNSNKYGTIVQLTSGDMYSVWIDNTTIEGKKFFAGTTTWIPGGGFYIDGYNFDYRKLISLTGSTGAGTDYQVKLLIGKAEGASGEDFDLGGHCEDDFDDIRFTDNDGSTLLNYWVESVASSGTSYLATVWVEVADSLESNAEIYIYYGNASATSAFNGDDTFLFFDDFTGDLSKWSQKLETWSIENNRLRTPTGAVIGYITNEASTISFTDYIAEARVQTQTANFAFVQRADTNTYATRDGYAGYLRWGADEERIDEYINGGVSPLITDAAATESTNQHRLKFTANGSSLLFYIYDETTENENTINTSDSTRDSGYIGFIDYGTLDYYYVDWVFVRKYASTEPVFSSAGSEDLGVGFLYRKKITLQGQTGAGTNYQVKLLIGESSGASGYDFHLGGKIQDDFDDIRFTDNDGETLLDYWIESISGTTPNQLATVWVEVADDLGSDTDIYIYYDNPIVGSASNGDDTFIFFDDFEGESFNEFWSFISGSGTTTLSNDYAHTGVKSVKMVNGSSYPPCDQMYHQYGSTQTSCIISWQYDDNIVDTNPDQRRISLLLSSDSGSTFYAQIGVDEQYTTYQYYDYSTPYQFGSRSLGWHKTEICDDGSDVKYYWDENYIDSITSPGGYNQIRVGQTGYSETSYYDETYIRKYASTEPAYSSAGSEEQAWGISTEITTGVSGLASNMSAVSDSSGYIHLTYIDPSNYVKYQEYTTSWQTAVTLDSTATNEYCTLAIDTAGNNGLYAFWIRDNNIYYRRGCSPYESANWDSATTFESAGGNSNDWSVASYKDFGSGKIFAEWTQGSTSPFSVKWKSLTPTICTAATISISGYMYENFTPTKWDECDGSTPNVKISVESGTTYTTTCNTDTGYFEKTEVIIPAADKLVSVYMDGETEDGVSVTLPVNTISDITINVYKDTLRIESVSGTSITNAKLALWDSGEDTDVLYTVDGSNNLSTASTVKTYINTGDTYAPGANVSTGYLEIVGTYTGASETLTLSGSGTGTSRSLYINTGTFSANTNTTVFTGSSESDIQETTYNNLELKPGANATYHLAATGSQTITINGNLIVGNETNTPTIDWTTYDSAITLKGSLDLNSPSVWTKSDTATLTWTVSGTKTWSDDNGTKQDIGIISITGGSSTPIIQLSTGVKATTLAVADAHELALNSQNLNVTNGALTTASTGTITCASCSAGTTTILGTGNLGGGTGAITFYNLSLGDNTETGTTTAASDFTVSSVLTIAGGTSNHTFNAANKTITFAGSSTPFVVNGTFTYNTSTIKYTGTSATNITSTTYYNVEFAAASGTPTYTLAGAIDVENDLAISNASSTLDVSATDYAINVGGSWFNSGAFTSQEGTVTFDSSDGSETIVTGGTGAGKTFYNIVFNNSGGGWTISTNDLTATNNFTLTSLNSFDASSRTITVQGQFKNNVGGAGTTWTGSTLVLDGSGSYCINDTKNVGGDIYATFNVSAGQYIRMWDSSASTYNITGTLYSMDHGANDGYLYIWGAYAVPDTTTDYWSYAKDFDGAAVTRQCQVTIQSGASITVGSGENLEIKGGEAVSGDKTTVTYAPASGSWNFNNDTGSELIIQEAKVDYMKVNSGTVTALNAVLDSTDEPVAPTAGAYLNSDWYVGAHLVDASTLANIDTGSTDVVISENSGTPQSTVWKYNSGSWGSASTYQETGTGSDGKIPQPNTDGAIKIREYSRTSTGYTFYYYNFYVKWQSSYGEYNYYEWAGDNKYVISNYYTGGGQDNVIGDSSSYDWHREDIDANNTEPTIDQPPAYGTFYCGLRPGLDFEIVDSDTDDPPTLELGLLEGPNYTSTDWLDLKVATSASHGYIVTAWALSDYTPNVFRHSQYPSTIYIDDFSGTYSTPLEWSGYCKDNSSYCGFGYTSNDPLVEGSNRYNSGSNYAKFPSASPGNIISDYSQPVSKTDTGGTYRMTVKASVPLTQLAGDYSTTLIFICTANY